MAGPLFQVALKRRLRVPVYANTGYCPSCGDCLDRFGDHALVCPCKGDRTVRHNVIRNRTYTEAEAAGKNPDREKAGLLPGRPASDGVKVQEGGRRPADVWLPRGPSGRGEALDFACTSGLRTDMWRCVLQNPNCVFESYEDYKFTYKYTGQFCEAAGFQFTPMVLETHSGAWSPAARRMLDWLASSQSATKGVSKEAASFIIAQRLSVSLHRENARAILKRAAAPLSTPEPNGWAMYTEEVDEAQC